MIKWLKRLFIGKVDVVEPKEMQTSDKGIDLIMKYEGLSLTPYVCSGNKLTIGYGHVIQPYESFGDSITAYQAENILRKDVRVAERAVRRQVDVALTQNQFDALVSFTFNLGEGNLARSTLLKKINAGDTSGAAAEFHKWVYAGGKRLKGLENRRLAERALFEGKK